MSQTAVFVITNNRFYTYTNKIVGVEFSHFVWKY